MFRKKVGGVLLIFFLFGVVSAQTLDERANTIVGDLKDDFGLENENIVIWFADLPDSTGESHRFPLVGSEIVLNPETLAGVDDEALTGLLAHELAHVAHYSELNVYALAFFAFRYYVSESFRIRTERATDKAVIQKGFGEPLIAFKAFKQRTGSERALELFNQRYLSIEETRALMNE